MRLLGILVLGLTLATANLASAQEAAGGWLGAELSDITKEDAATLGWDTPHGVKVVTVTQQSPAAHDLQPGDIIESVDKLAIDGKTDFDTAIAGKAAGTTVKLRLLRNGKGKTVSVKLAAHSADAKAVEDAPFPMLDTGGHMSMINDIVFTQDGKQIVSASDDKTVRVWDVATAKTVRIIRGEMAPGSPGKIYAIALSKDGKWLAVGGMFHQNDPKAGAAIRLYDFATGKLTALLKGHENVVDGLAFSSDGQRLISGSKDFTAIVWDVATAKATHRLEGHRGEIHAVAFTPDGERAVTASDDHDLRLWRVADGNEIALMSGHGDRVSGLAIASDGTIASGDGAGEIRLWDGTNGVLRKVLLPQSTDVGHLAFSPDGKQLLTGATAYPLASHIYEVASGTELAAYRGHDNTVIATAISPDGRWAATGDFLGAIHLWDVRTGERAMASNRRPALLGGTGHPVWAVGFSADGRQIAWGNTDRCPGEQSCPNAFGRLEHALTLPTGDVLFAGPIAIGNDGFLRAITEQGGRTLSYRSGGQYGYEAILDINEAGKTVVSLERGSSDGYRHRSYSFSPDGKNVISGGANGVLTAYDRDGNKLGDYLGHESDVWAVAPSPDGRYLVSGAADMTLRLWNLKTRELLVTLFRGADGEWVMWTPQGYYAASPAGAELIGWQINHGPENAADYVTAAQLRTKLNRPDIVAKAIHLVSAEEAVKQSPGTDFKLSDLMQKPVPRFRIVTPTANATLTGGNAQLKLALEPTPDPIKLIRVQVNGIQVGERHPSDALQFPVPLAQGRNIIRVIAVNETGDAAQDVTVNHDSDGALNKRGTLYILAIGVDKYPRLGKVCTELDGKTPKSCDLRVAGADAKAFADTMIARLGSAHRRVVSNVLVNGGERGEPVAANIIDALGELSNAQPNDTVLLFVSGHGITEGQNYIFIPSDAEFAGQRLRSSTVVPWANFQLALEAAKGRRILFLDTCHSGNSYNPRLTNDAYQANIIVYSASRWDQEAVELPSLGHGAFTYAVVEGINGKAKNGAGEIRAKSLYDFLRIRVRELASPLKKEQEPQYYRARDAEDYVLARVE